MAYYNPTWNTESQKKIDKSKEEIKKWIEADGNRSMSEILDDVHNCTDSGQMTKLYQELESYRGVD